MYRHVLTVFLLASLFPALSLAAPREAIREYEGPPPLPAERHAVEIRCEPLEAMGAPLTCHARIELTLTRPMPELATQGLQVELFYQDYTLLPVSSSPEGRHFVFEVSAARIAMDFTQAVHDGDISAAEARHPVFVERWLAEVYPISYSAPELGGVPLELKVVFPDNLRPEDTWWMLQTDYEAGFGVLEITHEWSSISISLEEEARFTAGGPIAGIGCSLRARDDGEERVFDACPVAVLGWEISYPDWLFFSFQIETDFQDQLLMIPTVEPTLFITSPAIAGMGFGFLAGVPIQLLPVQRVGLRGELTWFTWVFAAGIAVEVYPFQDDVYGLVHAAFYARLTL